MQYQLISNHFSQFSFHQPPPQLIFFINCRRNRFLRVRFFIEVFGFIIYQHLNKRTKFFTISHLPNSNIYATSLIMFALPISKPRFKGIIFFIKLGLKLSCFCKKNAKFSSAGGSAPRSPCIWRLGALPPNPLPLAAESFAPRPPKQRPIANFWLRACVKPCNKADYCVTFMYSISWQPAISQRIEKT